MQKTTFSRSIINKTSIESKKQINEAKTPNYLKIRV